ncbi:amino acid ABC transporter permease [Nocardioides piscis]|uniref:Amino acid ABC transporter permease n=1 Tax=Nocardioides piscis TaxID=2714938 RepID=A0A6G7YHY8_9ACTN|nr:amino acid ABC transporter permease [Nocardioides piscis]QIK76286.1 amino acid ABC transporter permease [Nocardioides piscis]
MPLKRSTRRHISRAVLYAVLLVLAVLLYLAADWPSIKSNFFASAGIGNPLVGDWGTWPDLITIGVKNTLIYTVIAFTVGLVLAVVLALMKLSPVGPYRWLATIYIEFFRGLPALLVVLVMAFGIPIAFQWTPPGGSVGAGVLGLILVAGAYMAETIRAGIQAVPKGQTEAARSLGMSAGHTTTTVVLPQAFRIVIPPLTNEFVLLIKDTALLFVIGFAASQRELTTLGRDLISSGPTAGTSTALIQAAILYLLITIPLTRLVAWLERKQQRAR